MEQNMHQTQMTMAQPHHQTTTAIHPTTAMHMNAAAAAAAAAAAGLPPGAAATGPPQQAPGPQATQAAHHHFLSSPALASPVGSTPNNVTHSANPPIAANAPCSTLFVANLGQFVSEHELKEVFSRGAGMESRHDMLSKKVECEMQHPRHHHHQFLMTTPT